MTLLTPCAIVPCAMLVPNAADVSAQRTTSTRCPAGYYCSSAVKTACGGNDFYCPLPGDGSGLSARIAVSVGHYSTGGTSSTVRY